MNHVARPATTPGPQLDPRMSEQPASLPPTPDAPKSNAASTALPRVARRLAKVDSALSWLMAYPLLTLQIPLLMLVSWGGLGASLGLNDLFWHHSPLRVGFAT